MLSGYSWTTFDDLTVFLLQQIAPQRVLDIGSGEGKYGQLLRGAGLGALHLTGLEFEPLRRPALLKLGYNEVRTGVASDLMASAAETFDVVILGDVIEHMRKSEGQDLLEYLNYRCAYILVVTPENMPMSSPSFYEGHNSIWRPDSMHWHDLWAHCRDGQMHFYVLRGLLGKGRVPLRELVERANAQPFMREQTSPNQTGHPRQLALHDTHPRDPDLHKEGISWMYRLE